MNAAVMDVSILPLPSTERAWERVLIGLSALPGILRERGRSLSNKPSMNLVYSSEDQYRSQLYSPGWALWYLKSCFHVLDARWGQLRFMEIPGGVWTCSNLYVLDYLGRDV